MTTIDERCYGYYPATDQLNALRTEIERLKAANEAYSLAAKDDKAEIERLKYEYSKLKPLAWDVKIILEKEIRELKQERDAIRKSFQDVEKEKWELKRKLERVREKISRKNTKRVADFDDFIAEIQKIIDGD